MIIGIGCEIVEIELLKKRQEQIAKRVLSYEEYKVYNKRINKIEYLAELIAAKSAVSKALPDINFRELSLIEIMSCDRGYYFDSKDAHVYISVGHSKNNAVAYATAVNKNEYDRQKLE